MKQSDAAIPPRLRSRGGGGPFAARKWWRGNLRGARYPSTPAFGGGPPPRASSGRSEKERGFTLVEMMVVIVIIGLLATIVIINVMPATERAAQARVRADLSTIEQAVDMYKLENLRYPSTQEGLNALVPKYIRRLPNDPWNSPYVYVSPGPNGAPYRIASLGADKREGGSGDDADVTN
jgi:general secretion pathway protein G